MKVAGGWFAFSFFKLKNKPELYMYDYTEDDGFILYYKVFKMDSNGKGSFTTLYRHTGGGGSSKKYYSGESKAISQKEYETQSKKILDGIDHLLFRNYEGTYGDFAVINKNKYTGKTAQEAIDYLKKLTGTASAETGTVSEDEWKAAFYSLISGQDFGITLRKEYGYGYHVVDFDKDGIPEIVYASGTTHGPNYVYYYDTKTQKAVQADIDFCGGNLYYIPGTGMAYTAAGRQGYYYGFIVKIKAGKYEKLYNLTQTDSYPYDGTSKYTVNEKTVTQAVYESTIEKNVPKAKRVSILDDKNIYNYAELLKYLKS